MPSLLYRMCVNVRVSVFADAIVLCEDKFNTCDVCNNFRVTVSIWTLCTVHCERKKKCDYFNLALKFIHANVYHAICKAFECLCMYVETFQP